MTAPDQCCSSVRKFLPRRRPHMTQRGHSAVEAETFDQFIGTTKGKLLEAIAETERHATLYVGIRSPIPSDTGFLPTYNRAIAINHFTLPTNRNRETANESRDKGHGWPGRSDRIRAHHCSIHSGLAGCDRTEFLPDQHDGR